MIVKSLLLLVSLSAGDPATETPRKPNPFAPSLPLLTDDEEAKLDQTIDRFIQSDTGKLRGEAAKAAVRDFDMLGPPAIPALIRGLNRAAKIEHSCPATVIGKKLQRMLLASQDNELLEFARDEIGSGVGRSRHQPLLQDLRVACMLHKNALVRAGIVPSRPTRLLASTELVTSAGKDQGPRLKETLTALEQRRGPEVLQGLGRAAASSDKDVQQLARDLIDRHLYRQSVPFVQKALQHEQPEVRRAAVRLVAARMPALVGELIDLLADRDQAVRTAAHQVLVDSNKGEDLGPTAGTDDLLREQAMQKWRTWWEGQKAR